MGAVGGSGGPRTGGPRIGSFQGECGSGTGANVTAGIREGAEPALWSSGRLGPGQGMGPCSPAGLLDKHRKVTWLEELCLFFLPIRESEITDFFLRSSLKDRCERLCWCKSRYVVARGPNSRHLSPLGLQQTSVQMVRAAGKEPPPCVGPSSWPSALLSLCGGCWGTR